MGKEIDLSRKTVTEDKDGNALITGKVSTEGAIVDAKDLTTKEYVDNAIAQASIGGEVDTSGFALKTELPTKTSQLINDSGFITSIPDEYVTNSEVQQMSEGFKAELDKKSDILNYSDHSLNGTETYNNLEKVISSESEAIYIINKPINLIEGTTCSVEVKFSDNTNLLLQGEVASIVLHEKQVNCIQITGSTAGFMVIDKARYTIKDDSGTPEHDDNVSSLLVFHPNANNVISLTITKPTVFEINNSFFTNYQFVNNTEKENWNNKADKSDLFSGDYNDLENKPVYDTRTIENVVLEIDKDMDLSNYETKDILIIPDRSYYFKLVKLRPAYPGDIDNMKESGTLTTGEETIPIKQVIEIDPEEEGVGIISEFLIIVERDEFNYYPGDPIESGIWMLHSAYIIDENGEHVEEANGVELYDGMIIRYDSLSSGELRQLDKKFIPDSIATKEYVNDQIAENRFSGDYNDLSNKPTIPSIDGLATETYVNNGLANKVDIVEGKALVNTGEIARLSKVDNYNDAEVRGLIEDLSESKADATSIPTKVSQLTNDSGFLTAVPATYATQAYVADAINKAQLDGSDSEIDLSPYALTSDLALKADKTELHTHENQTLLNSITAEHLTSMAEISDTLNGPRNYYNAETITDGVYLNSNGGLYENPVYFTTDYIPIAPGQTLYFYGANGRYDVQTNVRFVGFYDTGKNFIAGSIVSNVNKATNIYENGAYIRITVQHSGWGLGYVENVYPGVDIKYGEIPESGLWDRPQKIDVFLPNDIYCAVGTTIELYNNQVCLQADKLHLNWCCDYGHAMKRKFSFEGTSALAGRIIPVTLEIYNDYNVLKYTKTIQIHVVAATITNPITCVPIGDSWTNQKPWPGEVINLSGEKISFVGKFNTTVKDANGNWREYNHEGRSGFSAYNYDGAFAYTFGNAGEDTYHAFYNPTTARFDWNNYVNTVLGGTQPGAVILQMGINGIAADNTGMVGHEVNMINLIRQDNADIPIFVTLPAYKGNQDGLGVQESSDGHAYHRGVYDYLEKQKVMNYCSLLYEACKDMVGIYFIPLNICFDSEYNYGAQEVPVNPRATSIIEKIPMEAVHPQDYGYYQMADIVYSVMCGNLS